MSDKVYLNSRFGYREDTLENWEALNPVLERGEPAIVRDGTDGRWLKIGDGVTPFGALPWKMGPKGERGIKGEQGAKGEKGDKGDKGDRGASGVYVGSGDMPDDCNVQIDPNGSAYELPVTDQTYSPESENAQSGIAVAEAVSGKTEWETIIYKSLTQENAGASTLKIELPKDILKYKKLCLMVKIPYSSALSANAIKQHIGIADINRSAYSAYLAYGIGNQATPSSSGELRFFINVSILETSYNYEICSTFPQILFACNGANSVANARQMPEHVYKPHIESHPPYLHLILTDGTYDESTLIVLEGLR